MADASVRELRPKVGRPALERRDHLASATDLQRIPERFRDVTSDGLECLMDRPDTS
jgi:hypothetical protein